MWLSYCLGGLRPVRRWNAAGGAGDGDPDAGGELVKDGGGRDDGAAPLFQSVMALFLHSLGLIVSRIYRLSSHGHRKKPYGLSTKNTLSEGLFVIGHLGLHA